MNKARNELLMFVAGLAMLIAGLFIFSRNVIVTSGFGSGYRIGGFCISSGIIFIPLIAGIVWLFATGGSFASKVFTVIAVFLIVFDIVITTHVHLDPMTLFDWVVILVLIFGGVGLLAKVLLDNREDDYGYHKRKKERKDKKDPS